MNNYDADYFLNRGLEQRHLDDANVWLDYFGYNSTFCCLGDSIGCHTFALNYYGGKAVGGDISEWAIKHTPFKHLTMKVVDIGKDNLLEKFGRVDVVILYDCLEHLNTVEEVEHALNDAYKMCNKAVLISVPCIGNVNLDKDDTHHIKKSNEWWLYKVRSNGFNIIDVPTNFHYRQQLILGEKC